MSTEDRHRWRFFRSGGVDQVLLRDGNDIAHLRELDFKLWMALSMPVQGTSLDRNTLAMIDADSDGRIRPRELLEAIEWARQKLASLDILLEHGDALPLEQIQDENLRRAARTILSGREKMNAGTIGMDDIIGCPELFDGLDFNGDGILLPGAIEDPPLRAAAEDILSVMEGAEDACGSRGLTDETLKAFFSQTQGYLEWLDKEPGAVPPSLDKESATKAWEALLPVRGKIDDYFVRVLTAAYDPEAAAALNPDRQRYAELAPENLSRSSQALSALPLAIAAPGKPLPLDGAVNPAWIEALVSFRDLTARPLLGKERSDLDEASWASIKAALSPYDSWRNDKPVFDGYALGTERLRELMAPHYRKDLGALIARDRSLAEERSLLGSVERIVRYRRDLYEILTNYVNFADFYGRTVAAFQAGTLFLDARACSLCIEVLDETKHAAMAGQSGAFLVYCDITRPGAVRKKIVAAVTDGDPDTIAVGRNGIFVDVRGLDWDAAVTKVVPNPISVREAFWSPYKKLIRMVEEQIAKKAQAGDEAATATIAQATSALTSAETKTVGGKALAGKKFDLGAIALVGTAIGGVSALVGGFLQALFGLGIFFPLGIAGVLILISGPSMVLASLKLRKRNIGPLLDANGWAINTRARINMAFGASLTERAVLPPGALPSLVDPFADRGRHRKAALRIILALAAAAVLAAAWRFGWADGILPETLRYARQGAALPAQPASLQD